MIFYCLKAPSNQLIQLLHLLFFGSIKQARTAAVWKFDYENTEAVTFRTFACVLKKAWTIAARPEITVKGFNESRLFYYSTDPVLNSDMLKTSCTFVSITTDPIPSTSTFDNPIHSTSGYYGSKLDTLKERHELWFWEGQDELVLQGVR